MNKNISKLAGISQKDTRLIIGLMSGTSLDGLDIALCEVSGTGPGTKLILKNFSTTTYNEDFRNEVQHIFSKQMISLEKLCLLNEWIAVTHASMVNDFLKNQGIQNASIDLIASHGQTIYHAPKSMHRQEKFTNATLQVGDGDHIAAATGIITISDFRQKHVAAGGEGAPLAVYGDYLLFSKQGEDRILLNIGGIANFTWLPGSMDATEIFSTDTGPGNTMMDRFMQSDFKGKHFDKDALVAKQGSIHEGLLRSLKEHDFFSIPFSKTTGPELFNAEYLQQAMQRSDTVSLAPEDVMSTLNRFTADTIADALIGCFKNKSGIKLYASGGGMHNPLLMQHLKERLHGYDFYTTTSLGIDPDAKEAVLFALLANECVSGDPDVFGAGKLPAVCMGKISFPG